MAHYVAVRPVTTNWTDEVAAALRARRGLHLAIMFALTALGAAVAILHFSPAATPGQPLPLGDVRSLHPDYAGAFLTTDRFIRLPAMPAAGERAPAAANGSGAASAPNPVAVASRPAERPIVDYRVIDGDTLTSIATRFGISVGSIAGSNQISDADLIVPGTTLVVPPVDGVIHVVQEGEGLGAIAVRYGVSVSAITGYRPNGIADANAIRTGQRLVVPGGVAPPPVRIAEPERSTIREQPAAPAQDQPVTAAEPRPAPAPAQSSAPAQAQPPAQPAEAAPSAQAGQPGAPAPFTGTPGGQLPDPTGTGGFVTRQTAHLVAETRKVFPSSGWSCWYGGSAGDHPRGLACDVTFGNRIGVFPNEAQVAEGWRMARWLQQHAQALQVRYLIWQGQIWTANRTPGDWRPYDGGLWHDPSHPTGGHYDHLHISVRG